MGDLRNGLALTLGHFGPQWFEHKPGQQNHNGETERFTDPSALYGHISRAHGELASNLRAAESEGKQFDPSLHFPEAIRKVDVRIPPEVELQGLDYAEHHTYEDAKADIIASDKAILAQH